LEYKGLQQLNNCIQLQQQPVNIPTNVVLQNPCDTVL